ncbi:MAG TPA: hypothetical protein PKO06_09615 [Candidatus Ozemobacteraceae bacterium]|nr:hypothetical protein [Candidatus Ozemobacteraceae bacterium]
MVNRIDGAGNKVIIVTKPKPKESAEKSKEGGFDKVLTGRGSEATKTATGRLAESPPGMQPQNLSHMQRLEEIARQVKDGTYALIDPTVLADRIMKIASNKELRAKFIKKLLAEEADTAKAKNRPLTELDLKKLILMVKDSNDETFEDEELEKLLKDLA